MLSRVPLGQTPSLHRLRGRLLSFVRRLPRYYGPVRLPTAVHHRIAALALPMRPAAPSPREQPWDLPVPVHGGSAHAEGLRPRGVPRGLALAPPAVWPSTLFHSVGTPKPMISRLNTSPARTPVNASPPPLRTTTHDSGPSWVALPLRRMVLSSTPLCRSPGALKPHLHLFAQDRGRASRWSRLGQPLPL